MASVTICICVQGRGLPGPATSCLSCCWCTGQDSSSSQDEVGGVSHAHFQGSELTRGLSWSMCACCSRGIRTCDLTFRAQAAFMEHDDRPGCHPHMVTSGDKMSRHLGQSKLSGLTPTRLLHRQPFLPTEKSRRSRGHMSRGPARPQRPQRPPTTAVSTVSAAQVKGRGVPAAYFLAR